jgi:hypothetical protein
MQKVSDKQWEAYLKKYDLLIWKISRKISGDPMLANIEDNYADLCIAALNSIVAFAKKEFIEIDTFLGENANAQDASNFDKYTKTVLWYAKAKKGVPLSERMEFRSKLKSISGELAEPLEKGDFDIADNSASGSTFEVIDLFEGEDPETHSVIKAILQDPSMIDGKGSLKHYSLLKPTGLSLHLVNKAIKNIERILGKEFRKENEQSE